MEKRHIAHVEVWHEGVRGTTSAQTVLSVRNPSSGGQFMAVARPGHMDITNVLDALLVALDSLYPGTPF